MEENNFSGARMWAIIAVLVILVGVVVFFAQGEKNYGETLVEGVTGIQGVVVAVNTDTKEFTLGQKKMLKNDDGTFKVEENTYTVSWGNNTIFKTYQDVASLNGDVTTEATADNLAQYKNVIVTPSKMSEDNKTISAQEIRILPNLAN